MKQPTSTLCDWNGVGLIEDTTMKLILRASVTHLGEPGDLVEVKKGYARNYLLPNGKIAFDTLSEVPYN